MALPLPPRTHLRQIRRQHRHEKSDPDRRVPVREARQHEQARLRAGAERDVFPRHEVAHLPQQHERRKPGLRGGVETGGRQAGLSRQRRRGILLSSRHNRKNISRATTRLDRPAGCFARASWLVAKGGHGLRQARLAVSTASVARREGRLAHAVAKVSHRTASLALLTASVSRSNGKTDRKSTRLNSSHANISYAV